MSVVVVTGAGRGIGRAIAEAFAARGHDLALIGRGTPDVESVANAITQQFPGQRAIAIGCDVASSSQVEGARDRVLGELGAPAVVVNNAGVVHRARVEDTSEADWDHVVDVNLKGTFLVARAFLPSMKGARRGRLVQIASISATLGTPKLSAYCASKWGVVGFTKSLAEELRGTGLQTVAVLPGSVDTAMLVGSGFPPQLSARDVATTVVYLALEAPDAINGAAIDVFGP